MKQRLFRTLLLFILAIAFLIACGCISRLRQDLFYSRGDSIRKIKVVGTQLFRNAALADQSFATENVVVPGEGNVLVLTSEHRATDESGSKESGEFFRIDETVRFHLYLSLPPVIVADSIDVSDKMIAQQFGEYTRAAADLRYTGRYGYLVIDSIAREFLYSRIDAGFGSPTGDRIRFHGAFKARIER